MNLKFLTSFLILLFLKTSSGTRPQELIAKYLSVKLPHPNWDPSAIYDGGDSIYLFGGPESLILQFQISTEIVEEVGKLPGSCWHGTVQSDSSGNIFYFGGGRGNNEVYKFDPRSKIVTTVATLISMYNKGTFKLRNGTVYLLANQLNAFDLGSGTLNPVGTLKFDTTEAEPVPFQDKVFLFGSAGTGNRMALKLTVESLEMERVGSDTLPSFEYSPTAVTDGEGFIYILGGYKTLGEVRTDGIFQFNCHTYENHFIPLANLPTGEKIWWAEAPRCAFVQSSNRIYCFGGQSVDETGKRALGTFHNHDDIFYIDLTSLEPSKMGMTKKPNPGPAQIVTRRKEKTTTTMPTTPTVTPDEFSCRDREDGKYSHPTDPELYIECHHGNPTILHSSFQHLSFGHEEDLDQLEISTSSSVTRLDARHGRMGWIVFVIIAIQSLQLFSLVNVH